MTYRTLRLAAALAFLFAPALARAQQSFAVQEGAGAGYELALSGATAATRGYPMTLTGIAYEVEGLATLRPRRGLVLDAQITARQGSGQSRVVASRASARTEADGRFTVAIDVPAEGLSAPMLELTLHPEGQPGRRFTFSMSAAVDEALDLLTDRNRYQPGEAVQAWVRVRGTRSPAPRAGRALALRLLDPQGAPLAEARGTTGASGVLTAPLELPEGAPPGPYQVVAELEPSGPRAVRQVQVWRRTVERLLATIELTGADEETRAMVRPGGALRGRVRVTTPSGTPVRGAAVELRVRPGADPVALTTDAEGLAVFDVRAPAFLRGDVASETLIARAVHAAYGTIDATTPYVITRTPAVVTVTPAGGALTPEVPGVLYVAVTDPRGRPLREGTEVIVRGAGIAGGEVRAAIDAKGYVEIAATLPRAAASTMRGGECSGRTATTFEVEVQTTPPRATRACTPVAVDAELAVSLTGVPLAAPGDTIEARVSRRPEARGRAVLVEALWSGHAVASAWVAPSADRARLSLPADLLGHVTVRARAMRPADAREAGDQPGAVAFGPGAFDALLVRPADAFELSVTPERARYLVRERASVRLSAAPARPGWAALLVRDEAAHGGEGPWDLYWMRGALHEAARSPADAVNARFLRASLAASLGLDPEAIQPAPIETPYWRSPGRVSPYRQGMQIGRGVLRDPIALREELLRRGLTSYEMLLERRLDALGVGAAERASLIEERGGRPRFHPDVIAHLVAERQLRSDAAVTLGGEPITIAMIEAADPGFDFDRVARRVARARLAALLLGLMRLTDPDAAEAQRASASLPPERWLGTLVQRGMIQPAQLVDPWGRPFVFRRVSGRPAVTVSERALDWELTSPGPDGRAGTADDVRDPFARVVPTGTPYASASGEDALMRQLALLAPAQTVLTRMTQAYQRLSLAAAEEQRAGPVSASGSEVADESVALDDVLAQGAAEADYDMGEGEMLSGGGGGMPGRGRRSGYASAPAMEPAPAPEPEAVSREEAANRPVDRAEVLGAMVREDFPATLFFAGEVPLEGGAATIEVPLADALTSYHVEAIAWTASGWTTSGRARISVDQAALVDAPVPEVATVGDRVRLPVRVENRTDAPLEVEVRVQAEGLAVDAPGPQAVRLEPRGAQETLIELGLEAAGEGHIVVSLASGGEGIDAVRRPIRVLADARAVRDRRTRLIEGGETLTIDVPAEASARGPGQVRVAVGPRLFGDLADGAAPLWSGWALAMAGEPLPEVLEEPVLRWLTYEDDDRDTLRAPEESARALAAAWRSERLRDADAARALRSVAAALPSPEALRQIEPESLGGRPLRILLALAPVADDLARRPALRADVRATLEVLWRVASVQGARSTDLRVWAEVAAALALTGGDRDRAVEMVRRCERQRVSVGDLAWIEPAGSEIHDGRASPTAMLALALIGLGRRAEALPLVRALVDMRLEQAPTPRPWEALADIAPWEPRAERALLAAAAGRLAPEATLGEVRASLDGAPVSLEAQGASWVGTLEGADRPGAHRLEISIPEGAVALVRFGLTYGMPWTVRPRRDARVGITLDGELGARDTRAALQLTVQNRAPRVLTEPVVEIELPAGAELDEPTRDQLAAHLARPPLQDGRTLVLPLRPLTPGGWIRLPIPARWALSGTLRGLGAIAYDARNPERADVLPVSALPSRAVELPDEGPEPEPPEPDASEEIVAPPPLPILDRLVPEEG